MPSGEHTVFTNKESVNTQAAIIKKPFFSETNEIKLVIVGSIGSGKTTGIQAVSEIPVVCCEAKANEDDALRRKSTTTVAMDYGVFHLLETKLHLYGTPGQRRFLISKILQLKLKLRRSGMDCRNSEAMEGLQSIHPCNLDTGSPCRYDVVAEASL